MLMLRPKRREVSALATAGTGREPSCSGNVSGRARFLGTLAIVTGASSGIGLAVATLLAREGAQVILNARGQRRLRAARDQIARVGRTPWMVCGDVANRAVIDRLVALARRRFGRIDILVNNAGGGSPSRRAWSAITEAGWQEMLRTNLQAAFFLSQAVIKIMKRQGQGRIVNVASLAGRQRSRLSGADYASAKAGLLGLTRQLAWECGPFGIRVNAVAPGVTRTERILQKWRHLSARDRSRILDGIPLRRLAEPTEVAQAVAYLASDEASYVTGATLDVNGGSHMG